MMALAGIVFGLILARIQPFDKRLATAPYLVVTTGIAALTALLFGLLARRPGFHFLPFKVLGVNAMVMFMVHAVLILGLLTLAPPDSPAGTIILALIVLYVGCYVIADLLYRRHIFIRL